VFNNNSLFPYLQYINVRDTREVSCAPGELAANTGYDRESCVPGSAAGSTREGPDGGAPVREGPPAGGSPLSKAHIGTKNPYISVWKGGSLIIASSGKVERDDDDIGIRGVRKSIVGFSRASRMRFQCMMGKMLKAGTWFFITLTYPAEFSMDPKSYKINLKAFVLKLRRAFPDISGFWKLEPQKRGAPHFHVLVTGKVGLLDLIVFVPQVWYEVVGSNDPLHLAWHKGLLGNKPCVEKVESDEGVMWYASKYIGKTIDELPEDKTELWKKIGRYWGVFNRDLLPFAEEIRVSVTHQEVNKAKRCMRGFIERRNKKTGKRKRLKFRSNRTLSLFCNADLWAKRMEEIVR